MKAHRLPVIVGLLSFGIALTCWGDPPVTQPATDSETIQELRREVDELKQTVKALRTRLNDLEYQGLPQAPKLLPEGKLSDRQSPDAPEGYLRFPYDIERGTAVPQWWSQQQRNR